MSRSFTNNTNSIITIITEGAYGTGSLTTSTDFTTVKDIQPHTTEIIDTSTVLSTSTPKTVTPIILKGNYVSADVSGSADNAKLSYTVNGTTSTNLLDDYHYPFLKIDGHDYTYCLHMRGRDTSTKTRIQAFGTSNSSQPVTFDNLEGVVELSTSKKLTFNNSLENCSISYNPAEPTTESGVVTTITAIDGYEFNTSPIATLNGTVYTSVLTENNTVATITLDKSLFSDNVYEVDITANAEKIVAHYFIVGSVTNGSYTYTPEQPITGDTIIITCVADDGYYFNTAPTARIRNKVGLYTTVTGVIDNSDNTKASITISSDLTDIDSGTADISVSGSCVVKPDVPKSTYSFVNIYNVNDDNLKEIATKRFYQSTVEGVELVDLGTYVVSLKRFYVPIPTSIKSSIALGNYDTSVGGLLVSSDYNSFTYGSISIPYITRSIADFTETSCKILLPCIGYVSIDSDLIIGKTVTLSYKYSLINGATTVIVDSKDSEGNITSNTFEGNVSESVPYIMNNVLWEIKGNFQETSPALYGFKPYIDIVYRPKMSDVLMDDNTRYTLSSASGLCVVNDVVMDTDNLIETEYDMIINSLADGVIF